MCYRITSVIVIMMFLRFGVWASVWNTLPLSDPTVPVDFFGALLNPLTHEAF